MVRFNKLRIFNDIMLYGRGAGDLPTGSAIVSDIVYAAVQSEHKLSYVAPTTDEDFNTDFESEYYVRMSVKDVAGVLAKITTAFGKYGVSINSVQQTANEGVASVTFMIHNTRESAINKAIAEIKSLESVNTVDALIRVL